MGVFVTKDGAPAIGYSTCKGFQARFCLDDDGQQQVRSYECDTTGIIPSHRHGPYHRATVAECLVVMLHFDNQEKSGYFKTFCVYNPVFKTEHDQRAEDFQTQMRDDIKNHKTWTGVDDKYKSKHRLHDGSLVHRDVWELSPSSIEDE
jgi:hypothetical protein